MNAVQKPPIQDSVVKESPASRAGASTCSTRPRLPRTGTTAVRTRDRAGNGHSKSARRGVALLIGAFVLLLLTVGLVMAARSSSAAHPSATTVAARGTVAVAPVRRPGEIVVRLATTSLLALNNPRVVSADGVSLSVADVQPGDTVTVEGDHVVDLSQSHATLHGLVAAAPDGQSAPMVVQLSSGRQIVVDFDSLTQINGVPAARTSSLLIMDADEVKLVGVFDARLGEMTRTESIAYSIP